MARPNVSGIALSKKSGSGPTTQAEIETPSTEAASLSPSSSEDDEPLTSPSKGYKGQPLASPLDAESYFNSFNSLRSPRANSVYSLSRISLSNQLSQLTSLSLPNATSLSSSISSISTASTATSTLGIAAEQIRKWLSKAFEVLNGLDAEDDVEWAAAGGREGLGEVDAAIGKFEGLIGVYVTAIEDLQEREDISKVPGDQQTAVVDQMEEILKDWEKVRKSLKGIKAQVELAMEWEELWNVVLGDIGLEMENLSRLVFEMEEARHKALLADPTMENNAGLDLQELDTIVEETPTIETKANGHRLSFPNAFQASSPVTSPGLGIPKDDTRLLALFARMQPLRASLDFLPMTLSRFHLRAEGVLPTACQELESRRKSLEKKWKALEAEAEGLRQELGEDRWVLVFRNAGRQAQKLCESVERSISKLQESIDVGSQHSNPPLLAKKVEAYEAKKSHYGPAIKKVLAIIEKGVTDRLTVNGEILRLHLDTKARWQSIETDIKSMDLALDDLTMNKNQQLRDSISSIVSMDRSATGSAIDTPGSSPASSVAMGPSNGSRRESSIGMNGSSRRSSINPGSSTRPNCSRRYFSMPPGSAGPTQIPWKNPVSRSFTSDASPRGTSPSPYSKSSATPTPGRRTPRPTLQTDNKPRWNSSPKVDYVEFSAKARPTTLSTPPLNRKSSLSFRSPSSIGSHTSSGLPLPSPLGRSSPAPSPSSATLSHRSRPFSGLQPSLGLRRSSLAPTESIDDFVKAKEKTPPNTADGNRKHSITLDTPTSNFSAENESPSGRPRLQRPSTSMSSNRRISMLPVPKNTLSPLSNGRDSAMGTVTASQGRETSQGTRGVSNGRESRAWK